METYSVVSIICPKCGTSLEAADDTCGQCGASTLAENADGNPSSEAPRSSLMSRPWLLIIVILHVGLLGIPLYWRTNYSTPIRLGIIAASIVYTLFAVAAIVGGCFLIVDAVKVIR